MPTTRSPKRRQAPCSAACSRQASATSYGSQIAPVPASSAPLTDGATAGSSARTAAASSSRTPSTPLSAARATSARTLASSSSVNASTSEPLRR